jgi:hypothetical protein
MHEGSSGQDCCSKGELINRIWYRDQLSPWLREILLDPAARCSSYLRPNSLERMLKAHTKGHRNYAFELHKILTLEFIYRRLIELD